MLVNDEEGLKVGPEGLAWFRWMGIDAGEVANGRRALCRACLDWSERRHHLAGALGAALFEWVLALGWARRVPDSRIVICTPQGEASFRGLFE
ncbi:hypothetical protein [Paludibacterium paludis]|uniref:hypothetical protein n=1 Tax=Paludibacterium paludis TaxID=1225769 RepID=UPI001E3E79C9|nr:hypothetical protein [Paludibacterium paludis]